MPFPIARLARLVSCCAVVVLFVPHFAVAQVRDGRLHDPQRDRTAAAEGAPEGLRAYEGLVGDWDLAYEIATADGLQPAVPGRTRVEFTNRGHALLLRTRVRDGGESLGDHAALHFLAQDGNGTWSYSGGDTRHHAVHVFSGTRADGRLVLHDAARAGGGNTLTLRRLHLDVDDDRFVLEFAASTDLGETWTVTARQTFTRAGDDADFFPIRDDAGLPHPARVDAAAQFDFLLGEFDARNWLLTPGGPIAWPSNATATRVLDGYGILEFNWHDYDPSLPDAATSILRLYNPAMRRWESLFLTNRGSAPLHFGGVLEDERIVLHPFQATAAAGPLSQWIFYDRGGDPDAYRWKGLRSTDAGATWNVTWGIDFRRKGRPAFDPATAPPREVTTTSADGTRLYGDHYRTRGPGAPMALLFHLAGGDARGEYADIARRLVDEGYEVLAWDLRGGGDRFESENRTVARRAACGDCEGGGPSDEDFGYCDAYPDLEAALEYARLHGSGGEVHVVGSSYTAALVVRLAAEHPDLVASAAAFSPASSRMGACAVAQWQPEIDGPRLLVVRPESEMEIDSVAAQAARLRAAGVEVFVAPGAVHGASALNAARSEGDVEATWSRLLAFLGGE